MFIEFYGWDLPNIMSKIYTTRNGGRMTLASVVIKGGNVPNFGIIPKTVIFPILGF